MPTPPISLAIARERIDAIEKALMDGFCPVGVPASSGRKRAAITEAAHRLGISDNTLKSSLAIILRTHGLQPDWSLWSRAPTEPTPEAMPYAPPGATVAADFSDLVRGHLRRRPATLDDLAGACAISRGAALDAIDALRAHGVNIHERGGLWHIDKDPAPRREAKSDHAYRSRPDNTYLFGFTSDNHLGSKYARLDVLDKLYTFFADEGVDRVFNAGNWIDGEARFNKHDLLIHGMDAQLRHLAEAYPRRDGIHTFAVAGDDHEGWYGQREGVDIGRYAERVMREHGRADWHDLGYMECFVPLVNASTGKSSQLHVMHPGGGTAYAISYTTQKIVEAYEGGEKPAVVLAGHYHKLAYNPSRNVHAIQTGTTQDQTPFMRKKKLAAHIGGGICKLTQDPETGAITRCRVEFMTFFNQGYYNDRWNHGGGVTLPDREAWA